MNAAEEREADWVAQTKDLRAELDAAQAKLTAGLAAIGFWLDNKGFLGDMARDDRAESIRIVAGELRKALGDNA